MKKRVLENTELNEFNSFAKTSKYAERLSGKNCVKYERVSSKEQELGFSLETQAKQNDEAIEREGFNCLASFGGKYESAQTDERKEFNRMLNYVRKSKEKISYIVVADVTRFSRSGANAIYIAEQLRKENIKIYSVNNPTDTSTAAGKMQQNIQFVFAQYDNDSKREKIRDNLLSMLEDGYWCAKAPTGYTQITRHKRYNKDLPERQITTINETGKLIRKAFYWKAVDRYTNTQILYELEARGLKITKQRLDKIFANPFYCGLLSHNVLNGKLVKGLHEPLVPEDIFLLANNLRPRNRWKHNKDFSLVPLKNFMKCADCGSSFCGYLVKKKNLWYYKCNKVGCRCNRSAKALNTAFEQMLSWYQLPEKYLEPVKDQFFKYCYETAKDSVEALERLKARKNELNGKISTINERFVLGEISAELYNEFILKFKKERIEIDNHISEIGEINSNLENRVEKYIKILRNPAQLWASNNYAAKLELQELMFPQGIAFDRKNECFRTPEINEVAFKMAELTRDCVGKKKGDNSLFQQLSPFVPYWLKLSNFIEDFSRIRKLKAFMEIKQLA